MKKRSAIKRSGIKRSAIKKSAIAAALLLAQSAAIPAAFPVSAEDVLRYEAEDARMTGALQTISESVASGGTVVGKFSGDEDTLTFQVEIPSAGAYDLIINAMGYGGNKTNKISIDGEYAGSFVTGAESYNDAVMSRVILTAGRHEITITKSWGWIAVDYLRIAPSEAIPETAYQVSPVLSDADAIPAAKALFVYLCAGYGKQVLAGQVADKGLQSDEFKAIYDVTGKRPAILGLDMMDYTPGRNALGARESGAIDTAIKFHRANGIVTFCWHWNAPAQYLKDGTDESNGNPRWWGGFYTRNSTFDIDAVMNGRDDAGKALLDADIAGIAKQLLRLQEAGVPVLWRPLHEASGGWFWWGAKGAAPYQQLYRYLYGKLTNEFGCHNLIWVWNGQSKDWYPGDEYVDVIGEDLYLDKHTYSASAAKFSEILDYSGGKKMIALSENGVVFDIDNAVAAGTKWAWFDTWNGSFITKNGQFSDEYTEADILKKTYTSEYVITLDELPDRSTYTPAQAVRGDVNADGTLSVADAAALQKYLLAMTDTLPDWHAADLDGNGRLNAADLTLIKRLLRT